MNLIDTHFKKEEDFEIDLNPNILQCYNCKSSSIVNTNTYIVCKDCGITQKTLLFETWRFKIGIDFVPLYSRLGHWKKILRSVQGEQIAFVPLEIINTLKKENFINIQDLKKIMIKKKMKKYYLSIYWIYRQLTGKNLIQFEKIINIKLLYLFQDISSTFNNLIFDDGRKNFLQYHYVLIKCLRWLRKTRSIKHLFSMKDKKKIKYSETIFEKICERLNLEFIPEKIISTKIKKKLK